MIVSVRVTTNSPNPGVYPAEDGSLKVRVRSSPEKGAANEELIKRLAEHYRVRRGDVAIVSGYTKRTKRVKIETDVG